VFFIFTQVPRSSLWLGSRVRQFTIPQTQ